MFSSVKKDFTKQNTSSAKQIENIIKNNIISNKINIKEQKEFIDIEELAYETDGDKDYFFLIETRIRLLISLPFDLYISVLIAPMVGSNHSSELTFTFIIMTLLLVV